MSKGGGGSSIPKDYTFAIGGTGTTLSVDYDLDNIHVKEFPEFKIDITALPEIKTDSSISIKEIPPLKATVTTDSKATVTTNSSVASQLAITEIPPITSNLNIAVTEIPEQRVHYPAHYQIGFALLGIELWSLSLCGEAQVINEKYVPRRTEECR